MSPHRPTRRGPAPAIPVNSTSYWTAATEASQSDRTDRLRHRPIWLQPSGWNDDLRSRYASQWLVARRPTSPTDMLLRRYTRSMPPEHLPKTATCTSPGLLPMGSSKNIAVSDTMVVDPAVRQESASESRVACRMPSIFTVSGTDQLAVQQQVVLAWDASS